MPPAAPRGLDLDFAQLLARSPNPYVVVDRDLTIAWMNDAYLTVTERAREDIVGRPMFEVFPSPRESESYQLLSGSFARVLETGERDDIALIRYDITAPDGTFAERYWSATHTPLLDAAGQVAFILQHTVDVTELHDLRRLRDEMGLMARASAVQARNLDLLAETTRLRTLFEQAPGFVAILSGPEHRFTLANAAYRRLVGNRDVVGKTLAEALPEVVEQGFVKLLDNVFTKGEPFVGNRVEIFLDGGSADDGTEPKVLDFIYQPIFDADNAVAGVFVQGHDVTTQVAIEKRQRLLINELNHRVKNTLSIVQGLASQSFRRVENSEAAQQTFESRLHALAAAHTLLTEHEWEVAELRDVLKRSIEATAGMNAEQVHIAGPDVCLQPQTAVSLAMMIHELSTNALKCGALSVPGGMVDLTWTATSEGDYCALDLRWRESAGPTVEAPTRRGFGTRLIQHGMSAELKGTVELDFAPDGVRCRISARLPKASS